MIYLDHHAASPLLAAARAAMERAHEQGWGNPASIHAAGRRARAMLEAAREQVAAAIGARPGDVVLLSGGSEACNLAVLGLAEGADRLVSTTVEHPAVARAVDHRVERGCGATRLDPRQLAGDARPMASDTLAAVQWANHETGDIWDFQPWAARCRAAGAPVVVDACQALGKVPIDVSELPVDALAIASHKIGGPAGAGALWIRRGLEVSSQILGGTQERGRRAGAPDLAAQVGFGVACELVPERLAAQPAVQARRDRLERGLEAVGGLVNRGGGRRLATVTNVSFPGRRGETLVAALDLEGICASAGAACSSGLAAPSPVLRALFPDDPARAESALRFSLGPETTDQDVAACVDAITRVLGRPHSGAP